MRFINRFTKGEAKQGTIETFTCGCCFWFAYILHERFYIPGACEDDIELMYDQVANHFGCRINGSVYDITGDVTDKYDWETWVSVEESDETHAKRIIRECINF